MWPITQPAETGDADDELAAFRGAREEIRHHILTELLAPDHPAVTP